MGKNFPPSNSSFFSNRLPTNGGLNANSGFTWTNPKQNPLSPQFVPPKSNPVSRMPPKLPRVPAKAGLGLGKMAAGLRAGLPGLAFMAALMLLEWWLDQPSPVVTTSQAPTEITEFNFSLNPLKSYRVYNVSTVIFDYSTQLFRGDNSRIISGAVSVSNLKFYPNFPGSPIAAAHGYTVTYSNGGTTVFPMYAVGGNATYRESGGIHSFTVTDLSSDQQIAPTPSSIPVAPPYPLSPSSTNAAPVAPPSRKPATPSNPAPLGNPRITPPFNPPPTPKTPLSPEDIPDEEDDDLPFWFEPFPDYLPPDFFDGLSLLTNKTYLKGEYGDPVSFWDKYKPGGTAWGPNGNTPMTLKNPFSLPDYTITPVISPGT
ncbi:MAG: hypothetical protein ACKO2T_17735, partial [Microcystis aeruginosa]